jgi:HK97 family phage major capsid protein
MSAQWVRIGNFDVNTQEFNRTAVQWRSKQFTNWEYHVRIKTSETDSGALVFHGDEAGNAFGGAVERTYLGWKEQSVFAYPVGGLFDQGATSSNAVMLVRGELADESGDADVSGEGAPFNDVDLDGTPHLFPVRDVTARMTVSEDLMSDAPEAGSYINSRLMCKIKLREDRQLIQGDGSGNQVEGLQHIPGRLLSMQGADSTEVAVMRAIEKVYRTSGVLSTVVVVNSGTWLEYLMRYTAGGGFTSGPPSLVQRLNMVGARIVLSPACPADRMFVGDFAQVATRCLHTMGLEIKSSNGYAEYFGESKALVRAKERVALAVSMPTGYCEIIAGS